MVHVVMVGYTRVLQAALPARAVEPCYLSQESQSPSRDTRHCWDSTVVLSIFQKNLPGLGRFVALEPGDRF